MSDALTRVRQADLRIWTPTGHVEPGIAAARKVVEDYDEALMLARHELTGDWCVFLKKGPYGEPFPVVGLGRELPGPEAIRGKLYRADAKRRGNEIIDELERHNDGLQAEGRRRSDEATGTAAEAYEWGFRQMGVHPTTRIFVPRGV